MGGASFSHGASAVTKSEDYSHGSDISIQAAASSEVSVNQRADPEPARSAHRSVLSSLSDYDMSEGDGDDAEVANKLNGGRAMGITIQRLLTRRPSLK